MTLAANRLSPLDVGKQPSNQEDMEMMKAEEAVQPKPLKAPDLWAFDYWGRPGPGFILDRLTVVGPYPSLGFFREVRSRFSPRSIYLVVDESWRESEINEIRGAFPKNVVKVRYASCTSLVHAKLYLSQWHHRGKERWMNALAWGSANASQAAFSQRNAETYAVVDLAKVEDGAAVRSYFRQLREKTGAVPRQDVTLGPVRLALPDFSFRSDRGLVSFDAWVQAGVLCHKFEPDQDFGKLSIHLKQALPKSDFERAAERSRLKTTTEKKVLQAPYIESVGRSRNGATKWRSTYFVETLLGHWTSERCYKDCGEEIAPPHERRVRALGEIREADTREHEKWICQWLKKLERFKSRLYELNRSPEDYFEMKSPGSIDQQKYWRRAERQLSQQRMRAKSEAFASRYCSGFELTQVPSLRGNASLNDDFLVSFCESALHSLRKDRIVNRFSQTLHAALDSRDVAPLDLSGEGLLAYLRNESNWKAVGERITCFHQHESQSD